MINITYLHITSWAGMSLGATHCYGKLRSGSGKAIEIERALTADEAAQLNTKDREDTYHEGDMSWRYNRREDIVAQALSVWRQLFPDAVLLIQGRQACCDPQRVLDGPEDLVAKLNVLFERAEAIGHWDRDRAEMERICQEWDELVEANWI